MRLSDVSSNPILRSVSPNLTTTGILIGVTAASLVATGVGTAVTMANQQAVADYNAQIAQQNAQLAYQVQLQQAAYQQQAAAYNAQLAAYNQQVALAQAQQAQQFYEYSAQIAEFNAAVAKQMYDAQYQEQIRLATEYENYARAQEAQTEEEIRRIRAEGEQKKAVIAAKYGASGVTFEGSPVVVLSEAAALIETSAQDALYAGDLERRKQLEAARTQEFGAELTLLESDIVQANYELQAFEARTNGISAVNIGNAQSYSYKVQELNAQNQIMAATYDTHVAAAKLKISQNEADLIRMGGSVAATNTLMTGISTGISTTSSTLTRLPSFNNLMTSGVKT